MSGAIAHGLTRGVVFVHSAPVALCPHIGWALETVLGVRVSLDWTAQPMGASLVRAEAAWTGAPGTGARLASALRTCPNLRFDVVEEPSPGVDGSRWSYTPTLGLHSACVGVHGDILLNEVRVRTALSAGDPISVRHALEDALGVAWDRELEPYRHAGEGARVRWLHRVS
jgi:hypothetical protein